ncbi:MAG: DNA-3-methyladenine glycosylase family protein [Geodermatophilaceae bacterium]
MAIPTKSARGPVELDVRGPFDLAASTRFLEGFAPAARPDAAAEPELLRLAFPAEADWTPVGVAVRQHGGTVTVEVSGGTGGHDTRGTAGHDTRGTAGHDTVVSQVERILSLDVDGVGFPEVGRRDPVIGELQARYPGLRPVSFHSPYEAACWAIIGQRIRINQAAVLMSRLADQQGQVLTVAGRPVTAFPGPRQLRDGPLSGLPTVKAERLRAVATAALDGRLDAARLRSLDSQEALGELAQLPGVGPFSAQLILARGAGHPDLFPRDERRLHEEMTRAYGLDEPTLEELTVIADGWAPYRTWAGLLLRTRREDDTHEIRRGRRTPR